MKKKKKKSSGKEINAKKSGTKKAGSRKTGSKRISTRSVVCMTVLFLLICFLGGVYYYIDLNYTIQNVYVEGNAHYTDQEIIEKVMTGKLGHNSLYLNFKYRNQKIEDIPFVSALEVNIVTPDTVRITVYEKSLAGYVSYLGRYMYFDKDGTVVESSTIKTDGVPEVVGLSFDHVVMYEMLPIENANVFTRVLDITQSLNKYDLKADRIYFDQSYHVTLFFGNVRVQIGDGSSIDEKFSRLQVILPNLEGSSGVLKMDTYSEDTKTFTFQADKPKG